ncbi:protein phosphatase 1 regulatory subunit 15B-like isoform X2 [Tachysurus vachellii]|uniref:protein phosphatase 1 regulatory subunit 15B-like isoform X2 n=1 Tax=Tachysurus vachellii TaxID=175792 RepID=UPI00296AE1B9|nr:protein phosphatase 1 regulatory subunit 15B-like isoform X2 [Tachysurus vachellii]
MGPFSTLLNNLFSCWRPQHKTPKLLSLKLDYFFPTMTKTTEIRPFSSYRRKETVVMTRNSEIKMATIFETTVNPQMKAMINSDQLAGAEVLLTDWLECQSEKQDDHSDYETEWSEEEDWSDEGDSEMSPENRELWDSFLNNSDPYSPLCFSCPAEVKASDSDQCDDELVPSNHQETEPEWSEEEDSDWSDEGDSEMSPENSELWDSFLNNSDPYSPLCFSCPAGLKIKASEVKQNHTPSSPTAREVEEHNPDQNTKKRAKKVRFSEEVTIHTLEAWGFASQEARDGSCWMEMARDRERFKRRVEKAGELISPCLTAQHRARVLDRLRSHSHILEVQ